MGRIQNDSRMQFISKEFQERLSVSEVKHLLAATEYQEMNGLYHIQLCTGF